MAYGRRPGKRIPIKAAYEEAEAEYQQVKTFEEGTHNDNEYIIQFIDDLERLLPKDSHITTITFEDGEVHFELSSGWHETAKNEIADVLLQIGTLDYVRNFKIAAVEDKVRYIMIIGYDEDGNPIYWTTDYVPEDEEEEEEDATEMIDADDLDMEDMDETRIPESPKEFKEYEVGMVIEQGIDMIQVIMQRQVTYEATCHIGFNLTEAEKEALQEMMENQAPETVEEAEEEASDAPASEGGEQ